MTYSVEVAELVGTMCETVIYGIYLVVFSASFFVTYSRHGSHKRSAPSISFEVAAVFLFLCVTAHWVIDLTRVYDAFIKTQAIPYGASKFYLRLNDTRSVVRLVIVVCELCTLDIFLIYRLYVIWSNTLWVTVLPALTVIGTAVAGINAGVGFAHTPPGYILQPGAMLTKWITITYACSLATNSLAVSFIAFKILQMDRALRPVGGASLVSVLVIIVEGAGLNCMITLVGMIALIAGGFLNYTSVAIASPITGISFSMITLRVGLRGAITALVQKHTVPGTAAYPIELRVAQTEEHFSEVSDVDRQRPSKAPPLEPVSNTSRTTIRVASRV